MLLHKWSFLPCLLSTDRSVLPLWHLSFGQNSGLFILEYVEQGTLFDFLHQNEFNSDRNITWARQIAAGEYINYYLLLAVLSIVISFNRNEVSPLRCPRPGGDSWKSEINKWYACRCPHFKTMLIWE